VITVEQLGVLNRRTFHLRNLCRRRGIDISDIHLCDSGAEARVLAARLGSPVWWAAGEPDYSVDRLGINGETEIDGVPIELIKLFLG
jgi:hypothetical protein